MVSFPFQYGIARLSDEDEFQTGATLKNVRTGISAAYEASNTEGFLILPAHRSAAARDCCRKLFTACSSVKYIRSRPSALPSADF